MMMFKCNCCSKTRTEGEREFRGWYVLAIGVGGTDFAIYKFPKASLLKESNSGVFHFCSKNHLIEYLQDYLPVGA